jgi:signal transduction histidine kinase
MSRLVNDLLLLARADYGAITLDLYPLDLDTVFSEVYQQARVLVKDRNLKVVVGKFEPARIMGNADRLKQLLLNLVGNAIKFTPDGGQITLGLAQENGQAVITVRDTGAGIEPQHLERIFDRFYQAEPSRNHSELNSGAGLGLSIAKWIAEAHGGAIRVESEPSKGALFTVTLPLEATPPTPAPRSRLGKFSLSRPERDETPEPEGDRAV